MRPQRVFVGFSGGRASVALAHMCEPWRDQVTLVWVNTGMMLADMGWFVDGYAERFKLQEVHSPDLTEHWRIAGRPSDLLTVAHVARDRPLRLQPWPACCMALRHAPLARALDGLGAAPPTSRTLN